MSSSLVQFLSESRKKPLGPSPEAERGRKTPSGSLRFGEGLVRLLHRVSVPKQPRGRLECPDKPEKIYNGHRETLAAACWHARPTSNATNALRCEPPSTALQSIVGGRRHVGFSSERDCLRPGWRQPADLLALARPARARQTDAAHQPVEVREDDAAGASPGTSATRRGFPGPGGHARGFARCLRGAARPVVRALAGGIEPGHEVGVPRLGHSPAGPASPSSNSSTPTSSN